MGHRIGQDIAQGSAVGCRHERVLTPPEQVCDRVPGTQRTAGRGRDDLTDSGTEQRVADVDTGQRYAVGLPADQRARERPARLPRRGPAGGVRLRRSAGLPAVTRTAFVECAGNGRSYYTTQQGETVTGTAWTLGAIGVARWRGVRLSDVLRRAGLSPYAVDVQPRGLDAEYVSGGRVWAGCAVRCRWPRRWTTYCSRTR